jgi:hypothetical protein
VLRCQVAQRPSDRLGLQLNYCCAWQPAAAVRVSCFAALGAPTGPPRYSRRHFVICKFCPPSRPLPLMPLSRERRRRPSCCRQQQAGSRRFDISWSRHPEPGRMMAALGQLSWAFQPRTREQRMRRWRPSLGGCSSWYSPIVVRPTSDEERIESVDNGSC